MKMIVVSSGQLSQNTSKPITITVPGGAAGGTKTVTLAGKHGGAAGTTTQLLQTSSGQILWQYQHPVYRQEELR